MNEESKTLDKEFVFLLPANISKSYQMYEAEKTCVRKMQCLLDVFCQTVHFLGCTFLSEYLYSQNANKSINEQISGLFRPSLGTWYSFICRYYKVYATTDNCFIKEFKSIFKRIISKENKGLAASYHGRFKDPKAAPADPFSEVITLRNAIAHGASSPAEEDAEEILNTYYRHIFLILKELKPIFENYLVARCTDVDTSEFDLEDKITAYFDFIHYENAYNENEPYVFLGEDYHKFFRVNQMYLINLDKDSPRAMRYAEYLLNDEQLESGDDQTEDKEIYFLFDGYGNRDVTYLGYKLKKRIEIYIDQVKTKFTEHGASVKWTADSFNLEIFHTYVNDLASVSVKNHTDSGKYDSTLYVERSPDHIIDDFIKSDKTTLVVTAEAGVGKTNFLCYHTEKMIEAGFTVYFYNGSSLIDTEHENLLFRRLEEDCLEEEQFRNATEFLSHINQHVIDHRDMSFRFVMIIDAANEAYNVLNVLKEIEEITRLGKNFPWLKVIVSIRSISFRILIDKVTGENGKKLCFLQDKSNYFAVTEQGKTDYKLEIPRWNILQIADAIKKYQTRFNISLQNINIHNLSPEVQDMLSNPLNLRLYFNSIAKKPDAKINTELQLFETIDQTLAENQEIVNRTHDFLNRVISSMIDTKTNELESDHISVINDDIKEKYRDNYQLYILSPFERLLDIGILHEKDTDNSRVTGFVYQKYLEFCIYKYIRSKSFGNDELIYKAFESYKWDGLPEYFLAVMLVLNQEHLSISVLDRFFEIAREQNVEKDTIREAMLDYILKLVESLSEKDDIDGICRVITILHNNESLNWIVDISKRLNIQNKTKATLDTFTAMDKMDNTGCELKGKPKEEMSFTRAMICQRISDYDKAEKLFQLCAESNEERMRNNAIIQLAKTIRKMGSDKKAYEILTTNFSDQNRDAAGYAAALIQIGLCHLSFGDTKQALKYYEEALERLKLDNDYHEINYDMLGIGTAYRKLGRLDDAEKVFMDVRMNTSRMGYLDLLPDSYNGLSYVYYDKKEYQHSIDYAQKAINVWSSSRDFSGVFNMYPVIIKSLACLGKGKDEIQKYIDEAKKLLDAGYVKEQLIIEKYTDAIDFVEGKY